MNYRPRNRNESCHDGPKSTARWFDERLRDQPNPCGFDIQRMKGVKS